MTKIQFRILAVAYVLTMAFFISNWSNILERGMNGGDVGMLFTIFVGMLIVFLLCVIGVKLVDILINHIKGE